MSDVRAVPLDREQALMIEQLGLELLRVGDERATALLTIFLAWRELGKPIDANVVELHGWSRKVGA